MAKVHESEILKFPDHFLWGTSTSAYQVEGGNTHSDWEDFKSAGTACDQYNLYEKDFELISQLNHNAHRLSIEWSRIESEEGKFLPAEIEHYKKVLKSLKDKKITVMLTLWHFTLPKWVAKSGGWENPQTVFYFERFVKTIVPEIAPFVDLWITLNEPGVYIYEGYIKKEWPPIKRGFLGQIKTLLNLASAHKRIYKYLHQFDPKSKVGIAQNVASLEAYHKHSLLEQTWVFMADLISNHLFYSLTKNTHDFLGINYYFHVRFTTKNGLLPEIDADVKNHEVSDLGWEIYPEGLYDVLADLSSEKIPIYITECGIASQNDDQRNRFLISYLHEVYKAIQAGIDVRGFFYWSLIDNFEWHLAYGPKFGLIEVDLQTQKRNLRPSALLYTDIIQHNGIPTG